MAKQSTRTSKKRTAAASKRRKAAPAKATRIATTPAASPAMPKGLLDRLAIREVLENWVLYRDAGDWERFKSVWHEDGYMMATWFQGTHEEFAAINKAGMDKGVSILHFLGGSTIDIAGRRAMAQTKMSISQRAPVEGVLCDVMCVGRFYDFFEKRKGKWAIVLRRLFYEKDRIDPVDPSQTLKLDPAILKRYPVGYQHLAYLQAGLGFPVKTNMPGLLGPDADRLYALGRAWLANKPLDAGFRA
jgi:SnoaL-like domain